MKKIINKIPTGLLSLLTMGLILYVSLDSNPFEVNKIELFYGADKVIHGLMYFVLASVLIFDCAKYKNPGTLNVGQSILCALAAFVFSVLMEVLQGAMGLGRAASVGDGIANFVGALIGFMSMKYVFLQRFYEIMRSEDVK